MGNMITHDMNNKKNRVCKAASSRKLYGRAIVLSAVVFLLCVLSLLWILFPHRQATGTKLAYIYQNGEPVQTINLSAITAPYSLTLDSKDGGFNTLEIRPGSIGITDADCPDRLCVKMGFADTSLLPIICLPHGLVIEIKEAESTSDAISY